MRLPAIGLLVIHLAVVLPVCEVASAQEPSDAQKILEPGDELRATVPELQPRPIEGELLALSPGSLRMQIRYGALRGEILELGLDDIDQLEVERVGPSRRGRNALIGLGIGALLGFGLAGATNNDCFGCPGDAFAFGLLGGIFGLLGAGVGALSGGPDHHWEELPLETLGETQLPGAGGDASPWAP